MLRRGAILVLFCLLTASAFGALQLPSDITAEATSAAGAVVVYNAGANGSGDDENGRPLDHATCAPASGSQFPLGTTHVQCTASNGGGSGSFDVNVVDTKGPSVIVPRDFSVPAASSAGAIVTYTASANDAVDGSVALTCTPASGTFFANGTTTVSCSASDSRSNASSATFAVTVIPQPPPPSPHFEDITAEATGPAGAIVNYVVTGSGDDENGRPTQSANCAPASGSTFPLGVTTVHCNGGSFTVTVRDTTPPALQLPADFTSSSAVVTYVASAHDLVDGSVGILCSPSSGSTFATGTTTVHCSASDTRGNSASGAFNVTVEPANPTDTEPPVITSVIATPDSIWPPNHQLVPVTVTVTASDDVDDSLTIDIYDVTSNEPISGSDWNVTAPLTVELRADRDNSGNGRVYTIWVEAIDDAGNRTTASVNVTVPHDQGSVGEQPAQPPASPKRRRSARG